MLGTMVMSLSSRIYSYSFSTLGRFIQLYVFGRPAAIKKKIPVYFCQKYDLFNMFVSLRILIMTGISSSGLFVLSFPSFLLFTAPFSPRVCSFSLPSSLHSFHFSVSYTLSLRAGTISSSSSSPQGFCTAL